MDTESSGTPSSSDERPAPSKRWRWLRPSLAIALVAALWITGRMTGLHEQLDAERVRGVVEAAGGWGILAFVGIFALGELMHVPGIVFVAAAMFAYGYVAGVGAALLGALVSVTVSFLVVRWVGGQPLTQIRWRFARRILERLDARPILCVALLRLLLWMAPPVNYALAMSSIRLRDYMVGSALGLAGPVTGAALFFGWLFR